MIRIINDTDRRRSYRVLGVGTAWIEPGSYTDVVDDMPAPGRVRAFALSGLRIKPAPEGAEMPEGAFSQPGPSEGSADGREIAPLPGATGPASGSAAPGSVNIPADWALMPANLLREIAGKIGGNPVRSRAAAETIIRAELDRRGLNPAAGPGGSEG